MGCSCSVIRRNEAPQPSRIQADLPIPNDAVIDVQVDDDVVPSILRTPEPDAVVVVTWTPPKRKPSRSNIVAQIDPDLTRASARRPETPRARPAATVVDNNATEECRTRPSPKNLELHGPSVWLAATVVDKHETEEARTRPATQKPELHEPSVRPAALVAADEYASEKFSQKLQLHQPSVRPVATAVDKHATEEGRMRPSIQKLELHSANVWLAATAINREATEENSSRPPAQSLQPRSASTAIDKHDIEDAPPMPCANKLEFHLASVLQASTAIDKHATEEDEARPPTQKLELHPLSARLAEPVGDTHVTEKGPPIPCAQKFELHPPSLPPTISVFVKNETEDDGWFGNTSHDQRAWSEFVHQVGPCRDATQLDLFERFRTSPDVSETYTLFAQLLHGGERPVHLAPWSASVDGEYPYQALRKSIPDLPWKAKRIWGLLDKKISHADYVNRPCRDKRAVIIGAGPVGLRAAIELRLLGASVIVLEKRTSFDRINRLHLWEWCGEDLKELGARCLEPPPSDFGADPDLIHIGIGELQTLLFKTSLLLGVCILFGAEYIGHAPSAHLGWSVLLGPRSLTQVPPGPCPPTRCFAVDVLLGADGLSGRFKDFCGIGTAELGCVQTGGAIGLVVNFENTGSVAEKGLRSFNFARQFKENLFSELAAKTNVVLENIVYTRSSLSHYFVMTPTLQCLFDCGVVIDVNAEGLLASGNLNLDRLRELVFQVARFPFKPEQRTLADAVGESKLELCQGGPSLFDFSKMKRAVAGATTQLPPDAPSGPPLLCFLVGDALLEPFWPEGLGIVRGFFSALDCASAVALWASGSAGPEDAIEQFADSFAQLKSLTAKSRDQVLRERGRGAAYSQAPTSRYRSVSSTRELRERSRSRARNSSEEPAWCRSASVGLENGDPARSRCAAKRATVT